MCFTKAHGGLFATGRQHPGAFEDGVAAFATAGKSSVVC
jgi:hypothetical protein